MDSHFFSWERHNVAPTRPRSPPPPRRRSFKNASSKRSGTEQVEDLLVFGYSSKLYRDDVRAFSVNNGHTLIPWMGDEQLMIDRYDARAHLDSLSQFVDSRTFKPTKDEDSFEKELDLDRWADLREGEKEESGDQNERYKQFQYTYSEDSTPNASSDQPSSSSKLTGSEEADKFNLPANLKVPDGIQLPPTNKHHLIIEKTARHVAQNGLPAEILLKTRQSNNPSFNFLFDHSELYGYYQFLLKQMKSNSYHLVEPVEEESESDSGDEYLHPSLLAAKKTSPTVYEESLARLFLNKNNEDNPYSQLLQKYKPVGEQDGPKLAASESEDLQTSSSQLNEDKKETTPLLMPVPTREIDLITIDKLAERVAKNGEEFELSIKELRQEKFDFVNNGHQYHPYYVKQKLAHIAKFKREEQEKLNSLKQDKKIVFTVSAKDEEPDRFEKVVQSSSVFCSETDSSSSITNDLQRKRRMKLREFLKKANQGNQLHGPNLPVDTSNLSPTISAVTSPSHSPNQNRSPTPTRLDSQSLALKRKWLRDSPRRSPSNHRRSTGERHSSRRSHSRERHGHGSRSSSDHYRRHDHHSRRRRRSSVSRSPSPYESHSPQSSSDYRRRHSRHHKSRSRSRHRYD